MITSQSVGGRLRISARSNLTNCHSIGADQPGPPLEGETVVGRNYHSTHGGKGYNMAACAARLGARSAFILFPVQDHPGVTSKNQSFGVGRSGQGDASAKEERAR